MLSGFSGKFSRSGISLLGVVTCFRCGFSLVLLVGGGLQRRHPDVLVVTQLMADPPHRADGHVEVYVAVSCCWLSWRLYVCLWLLPPLRADVLFANSEWGCL